MGCYKHNSTTSANCVVDVVQFIDDLQNAVVETACITGCLNPVLGEVKESYQANTRPFILFTENGEPFTAFYHVDGNLCPSFVFRVESVEGTCCLLRVLGIEEDEEGRRPCIPGCIPVDVCDLFLTDNCITVDLRCFCGIECLRDIRL